MPLSKASSDHFGYSKQPRTQWQRSKSSSHAQPVTPRPLAPVSEKTKHKLNQFQYQSRQPASKASSTSNGVGEKAESHENNHSDKASGLLGKPADVFHDGGNGSTSTLLGRVSLQDLLAKDAKTSNDDDFQKSPGDQIMWNNKQDPAFAAALSPMMPRKGRNRKRARSSSPMSSPLQDNTMTPAPAIDRKKLTEALRSPHADPTLQLWDRLAMSNTGNATTPVGATSASLAQFMVSSSPRPSKDTAAPQAHGGLRRTLSSGLSWPKRRRVDRSETKSFAQASRGLDGGSKTSLVTALLDTVEKTPDAASPSSQSGRQPLSDSPSPRKGTEVSAIAYNGPSSPSKLRNSQGQPVKATIDSDTSKLSNDLDPASQNATDSDYGDDGLLDDDDTLMQLEASIHVTQQPAPSKKKDESTTEAEAQPIKEISEDNFDDEDFDELDDNAFAAAESLMAGLEKPQDTSMSPLPVKQQSQQQLQPLLEKVNEDLGDDFGDDFGGDFDFEAAELAATQSVKQPNPSQPASSRKPRTIQRYLVTNVLENEYVDNRQQPRLEKILLVQVENSKSTKTVHLRGDWYETPAHAKSFVHIIGSFTPDGRCIIDDDHNMLILHPDQLISATVVADSFTCMRRAVLQDRVKATSEATPPLVYGTILHEIFQAALLANQWDSGYLSKVIDKILEKHVENLYKIKVGPNIAKEHLQSKMPELSNWAKTFVASQPSEQAVVNDRNGKKANMCVSKLLDVEEHVWSPMYGLKGNIDATVQVTMKDGKDSRVLTVPFEVKTGRNANSSHMAQTALYNLLLSDRYDIEILYGILYYMESSQTTRIPAIRHELRHMIMQRNQLACYVRERSVQLPPMKKSKHMCGKCYAKTSCFIYHRLADDGDGESSGMEKQFDEVVKHLTPTHKEFFVKWEELLTKEEKESQKLRRELWTMVSKHREKLGRAFADVIIEEGSWSEDHDSPNINRYRYNFVKLDSAGGHSFLESQLAVGEPIVVSDEQGHFALALGYVTSVRKQRISVAVDRRLHNARTRQPGFDEKHNQVFAGIMEVEPEGCGRNDFTGKMKTEPMRYRLDKDEFSNGMATVRNNLVQVMADDVFGSRQIRRLVVDLVAPRFKATPTQYEIADRDALNVDQHKAIQKVMSAQDYALVLGMPGTGKTTTIAHIIRALTSQGKSVLLTSYTHTAVDNILLKLKHDNLPILRLGAPAKVHPDVQHFATLAGAPMHSFDEIKDAWHGSPIVATTCLGIGHPVFNERTFDYCIVDEASQITLPICLGPIRMAQTFVLVGDHNQLPPLVQNEEAREGGLDVSLFKLLSTEHPDSVVNLEHQYRMCEDIMTLSNTLIYHGRLRCGTEQLRHAKLHVPNMSGLQQKHYDTASLLQPGMPRSVCRSPVPGTCWLRDLLEPEARVRFVNTDTLDPRAREEAKGSRIVNSGEARIVTQLVDALLAAGVPAHDVGVMTHYRSQLALLKHGLRGSPGVELHTADRFQGRDKDVVVLSLVRSNEACSIGDLLKDWRRINVAFTRAKTKLLVVGSRETLRGAGDDEMLAKFIALMEQRDWVYDLPGDALESHYVDEIGTQATAGGGAALSPLKSAGHTGRQIAGRVAAFSPPTKKNRRGGTEGQDPSTDKENRRPEPKRVTAGQRVLTKNRPVIRDILNEMMNGEY